MKILSMVVLLTVLTVIPGTKSLAVEYFPTEPGPVYVYGIQPLEIRSFSPDHFSRVTCPDCPNGTSVETYFLDPSGDIFYVSTGFSSIYMPDPDSQYFEPYVKFLDFPLEDSKTWSSTATYNDIWGGPIDTVTLTVTVQGVDVVSVPAGDFEVKVVTFEYFFHTDPSMNTTEELWLHSQLGPVNGLASWTGVVGTETSSWGGVKSLYR